jgi:hypothetical protein
VSSLLDYGRDDFSQNGEDGVIARIFDLIGTETRACGEIGAWDGEYLSNSRSLILQGWSAVLAEADPGRYSNLTDLYRDRPDVRCVNETIGVTKAMRDLLNGMPRLDYLSIDIDGLDYELMADLPGPVPRVLCIEVGFGHHPSREGLVPREIAARGVGQPLRESVRLGERLGYRLVALTGNAFFVQGEDELPTLTSEEAYGDCLARLSRLKREWIYLANLGRVDPFFVFGNELLTAESLGIAPGRARRLRVSSRLSTLRRKTRQRLLGIALSVRNSLRRVST